MPAGVFRARSRRNSDGVKPKVSVLRTKEVPTVNTQAPEKFDRKCSLLAPSFSGNGRSVRYSARAYGSPLSLSKGEGNSEGYSEQARRVAAKTPHLSLLPSQRARRDKSVGRIDRS